ncbi:MAG TPA: T9SS type A sorting domain-containing protein [Chitinophagales bacterium]|nr:T9SS type A sorting domain-containing protein [Chitinophagales bacterium]
MTKKSLSLLLAVASCLSYHNASFAQNNCTQGTAHLELNVGNVRTQINNGGDLWRDAITSEPKYEFPKVAVGSGQTPVHAIYAGGLWLGALDDAGAFRVAASTYRQSGVDFFPGTIAADGSTSDCSYFDRLWEVHRADIDAHVSDFAGDGTINAPIAAIMEWPGRNNPALLANPDFPQDHDLAPFIDLNANGNYEPLLGDYPDVPGDQAIWCVFNDAGNVHGETGGQALDAEIHQLAYAFAAGGTLGNTTFYRYTITNRSNSTWHNFKQGIFVDGDLGRYTDDFVGCDVSRNMGIYYNGDGNDEGGYGTNIPLLGIKFLYNTNLNSMVYYNNDFGITGNPANAADYYDYLKGHWKDGSTMTYGATGTVATNTPYSYMFPSDPSLPAGSIDPNTGLPAWSECSQGNTPGDRRMLLTNTLNNVPVGGTTRIDFAVIAVRDNVVYPCPSFAPLQSAADEIQSLFDDQLQQLGTGIHTVKNGVSPQPTLLYDATQHQNVLHFDATPTLPYQVQISNVNGQTVASYRNQSTQNLGIEQNNLPNGIYFYHVSNAQGKVATGKMVW